MQIDDINISNLTALINSPELEQLTVLIDAEIESHRKRLNFVNDLTAHEQSRLLSEINAFEISKSVVKKNLDKLIREIRNRTNT